MMHLKLGADNFDKIVTVKPIVHQTCDLNRIP